MNDLPAQSYIVGFLVHDLNRIFAPFLAVRKFEDVGAED